MRKLYCTMCRATSLFVCFFVINQGDSAPLVFSYLFLPTFGCLRTSDLGWNISASLKDSGCKQRAIYVVNCTVILKIATKMLNAKNLISYRDTNIFLSPFLPFYPSLSLSLCRRKGTPVSTASCAISSTWDTNSTTTTSTPTTTTTSRWVTPP